MALTHILTDGTENGETAAIKINAGFTQSDSNLARITANEADIVTLQSPADKAALNPVSTPPAHVEGQFYYNDNTGTFNIQGPFPGIEVSPGHGEHLHVINNSGLTIEAGMAVRIDGVAAGIPQIVKAQADTFSNANVIGITSTEVLNGAETAIAISGLLTDMNTNGVPTGVPLYLSDTTPGIYSSTVPAIKTEVGGCLVADATIGQLRVHVKTNQVTPAVLGGLKSLTVPLYNVTTTPQDIVGWVTTREVVTTVNATTGEITLPNDGDYRVHFTAAISFPSAQTTRSITLELYDVTGALIHFPYVKNIPRDATQDSLSFAWTLEEVAGNVHKMRVKSNVAIDVTFDNISFDIESISITQ